MEKNDIYNNFDYLNKINIDKVSRIPYQGEIRRCRLKRIIDGDTVVIITNLGEHPVEMVIRIEGIDAPEKSKTSALEIKAGNVVCNYVTVVSKAFGTDNCYYKITKHDKYGGRYIGDIYFGEDKKSLSEHLKKCKCVKIYNGGKKEQWNDKELETIIQKMENRINKIEK